MVRVLEIINPLHDESWDDLVMSANNVSFFHSSAWARVLVNTYGFQPIYFIQHQKNQLRLLVPMMEVRSILTGKRGVSIPFSDHCEILLDPAETATEAFKEIVDVGKLRKWRYLEIRSNTGIPSDAPPSACFIGHELKLKDEAIMLKNLRGSTRRNISTARRKGVKVCVENTFDSVAEYYRLHCMTRKKHGIPPQPFAFFKNIFEHIIKKKKGRVFLASHEGSIVSGNIYFHFKHGAYYKFGASDHTYQHLRASNLVMWEAIRWYSSNGYQSLCFGRTSPSNTGLLQYKRGWGAEETELNYYRYDLVKDCFHTKPSAHSNLMSLSKVALKLLPSKAMQLIGSLLYKHTA